MVLHTIINEYDILQARNQIPLRKMQAVNGGLIEYTVTPLGKEVSRLITTDPNLYLNRNYLPYAKLQ